jgi:hypothetical protein
LVNHVVSIIECRCPELLMFPIASVAMTDGHESQQRKSILLSGIAIVIILVIVSLALWR